MPAHADEIDGVPTPLFRLSGTTYAGTAALPWIGLAGVLAVVSTLVLEEPLRRAWRSRGDWPATHRAPVRHGIARCYQESGVSPRPRPRLE